MNKIFLAGCCSLALLLSASTSWGASTTYILNATGDQEAPGPGDPDGLATGSISFDDMTGEVSWIFNYSDIAQPTAMHIHGPGGSAGTPAGVFLGLGVAGASGTSGTLMDSLTTSIANVTDILANPTDFYVNIHNNDFAPGAVRGQLGTLIPEPTSLALAALAISSVALRRKRS